MSDITAEVVPGKVWANGQIANSTNLNLAAAPVVKVPVATLEEAIAGENETKVMTAKRVAQSLAELASDVSGDMDVLEAEIKEWLKTMKGKQVFLSSGTWTHPEPASVLPVTLTVVGGGGGGTLSGSTGSAGTNSSVTGGSDTVTALGGAGGGSGVVLADGVRVVGMRDGTGPAGIGLWGRGGWSWDYSHALIGENGQCRVQTITTTGNLTVTVGAGGAAGGGQKAGFAGLVIVEW